MSYICFNTRLLFFSLLCFALIILIAVWFYKYAQQEKWFVRNKKLFVAILVIITSFCCLLILISPITSLAKSSDEYKDIKIVDIVANEGRGGFIALKSFTLYYQEDNEQKSCQVSIFSTREFKGKVSELRPGDVISAKITSGFNHIYDFYYVSY